MTLNEEVDDLDSHVTVTRQQLQQLCESHDNHMTVMFCTPGEILRKAQHESISTGSEANYQIASQLSREIHDVYSSLKDIETNVHASVDTLGQLNKATPLHYMIQMSPRPSTEEVQDRRQWLHLLGDRLSPKTNTEMRLELCILQDNLDRARQLLTRIKELEKWASSNRAIDWDSITSELATNDFSVLQDDWMQSDNFRYAF